MSDPETHRRLLFHIAYRMLGRVEEAEDMVQETLLRWHRADTSGIREPQAWLTATVTRLCIDQLRLARRQREEYVGVWLPEPVPDDAAVRGAHRSDDSADDELADRDAQQRGADDELRHVDLTSTDHAHGAHSQDRPRGTPAT